MNEPQTTDAGQASVASGEAEPPIFDDKAMDAACREAVATCATEFQAFNDALGVMTNLDKVHKQLFDRATVARATLDAAMAEHGNAETSLMIAETGAEIDGREPAAELSAAIEPARQAVAEATANLARIEAALGILPARIAQADAELERAAIALKGPLGASFRAVQEAQERLMLDAARPFFGAIIVGYALADAKVMSGDALGSVVIPSTNHKAPPLLSRGRIHPPTGDVITLSEHISDIPLAEALRTLLRPLGQARRAMDREVSRIEAARRLAQQKADQARGGMSSVEGPQSRSFEIPKVRLPDAKPGMPDMVYRTPGVREGA